MKKDSTPNKFKNKRRKILRTGLLALAAVIVFLAFFLGATASDGTEKFSGQEQKAAQYAIRNGYDHQPGGALRDLFPALKARAVNVRENTLKKCGQDDDQPIYIVSVAKVTFFGIERTGYSTWVCNN